MFSAKLANRSSRSFKAPSKAFKAADPLAGVHLALEDLQALRTVFSAASLELGDLLSSWDYDEEIFTLRLRSIPGPA